MINHASRLVPTLSLSLSPSAFDYGIIRERSYSYDARGPRASFRLCAYVLLARRPTTITTNPAPPIIKPHLAPPLLRLLFLVPSYQSSTDGIRTENATRRGGHSNSGVHPSVHPFSLSPRSLSLALARLINV